MSIQIQPRITCELFLIAREDRTEILAMESNYSDAVLHFEENLDEIQKEIYTIIKVKVDEIMDMGYVRIYAAKKSREFPVGKFTASPVESAVSKQVHREMTSLQETVVNPSEKWNLFDKRNVIT